MREITRGTDRSSRSLDEGLTAEMFNAQKKNLFSKFAYKIKTNKNYSSISTDCDYRAPLPKHIAQLQNHVHHGNGRLSRNEHWLACTKYVCMYVCMYLILINFFMYVCY